MGARAIKRPATIKDPRKVKLAMRQSLLPFAVRKPRFVRSAVALPLMSRLFATLIVAQLSSLLCIFDSDNLALTKSRNVAANNSSTVGTAELGHSRSLH